MLEIRALNLKQWEDLAKATSVEFHSAKTIRNVSTMLNARFRRSAKRQFQTEGSFGGSKWVPLSERYAKWKRKKFPGKTILRRKDILYRSYTSKSGGIGFGNRMGAGWSYKFGSDIDYADYHEKGAGNLPKRPVMEYTPQQLKGISAAIGRTIVQGLFSRRWFDDFDRGSITPGFRNTGFDSMDII